METKRSFFVVLAGLSCCAVTTPDEAPPRWSPSAIASVRHWVSAAPEDALPVLSTAGLDLAIASRDPAKVDGAATALALQLARMQLLGSAGQAERRGWNIPDTDTRIDLPARLQAALTQATAASGDGLDRFFSALRPQSPEYAALRGALAAEQDPARRRTIALNMERWRWMPVSLGEDYVLVNVAAFEVGLWRGGSRVARWPVIVGKPRTPSPVFAATVNGVTFNPWWEVPANIARESVAALVRNWPAIAKSRGYVQADGHYRQRPGPANALGQMKLAMPNPYNVYLHDTPDRKLFAGEVRAFSHGCIRVGNALDFAGALLQGKLSAEQVSAIAGSGRTVTIALPAPLPVYVAYFTAARGSDDTVRILPDIYGRDANRGKPATGSCAA
ncbi:MAG: L,D-transpeptidase family protein [Sphingomonadales bacterium]|nr:L,D-transpeptidase family protein [Sphingomonadales bacterium]